MAYVVLALGVLMAALGLYGIVTGYPMIQIERGWATVIAGSVVLTGGLVTVAVGFAIRALADIRAVLLARPGLVADTAPFAARVEPQPVAQAPLPDRDAVPVLAAGAAAPEAMKPTEPLHGPAHDDFKHDEPLKLEAAFGQIEAPPLPASEPVITHAELDHRAVADAALTEEPATDGYELQSPSTAEHDLAPHAPPTPPTEEEDWLDRALSDFESGLSTTHPAEIMTPEHVSNAAEDAAAIQAEVPPIHPEPAVTAHAEEAGSTLVEPAPAEDAHAEPLHAEPAHSEPAHSNLAHEPAQPAAAPRLPSIHDPAPHDLAVIGRYESDGTSYIMYADGSIEAQSDAGVYRFRSMAELKTFIES